MNMTGSRLWTMGMALAILTTAAIAALALYTLTDRLVREKMEPFFPHLADASFELISATGGTISNSDLIGQPRLIFFGFTHCPEICPTTLYRMSSIAERLDATDQLGIVFVTVDPERDTADLLTDYISNFAPNITALTGTPAAVRQLADHYKVVIQKVDLDDGDYTVDHTASVFMFDRMGEFSGIIAWGEADATIEEKIKRLIK
jgi:protein SCO1/2